MKQFWTVIDEFETTAIFRRTTASVCGSFVVLRVESRELGMDAALSESMTSIPFESPLDAQIWIDEEVKAMKGEK